MPFQIKRRFFKILDAHYISISILKTIFKTALIAEDKLHSLLIDFSKGVRIIDGKYVASQVTIYTLLPPLIDTTLRNNAVADFLKASSDNEKSNLNRIESVPRHIESFTTESSLLQYFSFRFLKESKLKTVHREKASI